MMRCKHFLVCSLTVLWLSVAVLGQQGSASSLTAKVRAYRAQHEVEIVRDYADLLSLPNVATGAANIARNAERIGSLLHARGVNARLLDIAGAPPIVFAELTAPGATHTIIIYAHYDGQPVDESQWASPPWRPRLLQGALEDGAKEIPLASLVAPVDPEARIYARAAGDDKAPIQASLSALDALRASAIPLGTHVKLFFEGEKEQGSAQQPAAIHRYPSLLNADACVL